MKSTCEELLNVETANHAFTTNLQVVGDKIIACFYSCYREAFIKWTTVMYSNYPESLLSFIAETAFTDSIIKFRETVARKGLYNSGAGIKTILFHFFKNSLRDHLQQESRRFEKEKKRARLQGNSEVDIEQEDNEILFASLQTALDKMVSQDRQIIQWRHLDEKSIAEIAQLLAIAPASATNRIYRCMQRLHSLIQNTQSGK